MSKEILDNHERRIIDLEDTMKIIKNNLAWHKKIGYYIASILTVMAIKLMFGF